MKNVCRLLAVATLFFAAPVLAAPLVIGGTIVTPQGPRPHAWLVVEGGKIAAISDSKPAIAGAKVLQTDELIFPGFVDLHNHPLWAVFPRFAPKPPPAAAPWPNRYAWRSDARYHKALQDPWWDMMSHGAFCALDEYAELQALIGGTTSITGLDLVDENAPPPGCIRGLARNLDYYSGFYGSQTGQERVAWVLAGCRKAGCRGGAYRRGPPRRCGIQGGIHHAEKLGPVGPAHGGGAWRGAVGR
jgi:hypothetical protein